MGIAARRNEPYDTGGAVAVTVQDLVDRARRARTGTARGLSPIMLGYALREVLGCMLTGGVSGRGSGSLDVGAWVLAAVIADLEESGAIGP
jgi:hypothetical protein